MDSKPEFINEYECRRSFNDSWSSLVEKIEQGFIDLSNGNIVQPFLPALDVAKYKGSLEVKASLYPKKSGDVLGAKLLTEYLGNKEKGLPTVQSTVLLYDATNGSLKAILEGIYLTEIRTAASSMVATKFLAVKNPEIVAMIGAGHQGKSHYQALKHFYDVKKFRIWSYTEENGRNFMEQIIADGNNAEYCVSVEEAVREADIINLATLSKVPILKKPWVKKGAHINAVGACDESSREIDDELMQNSVIYADSTEAVSTTGDVKLSGAKVYAELGQLASGKKEAFPLKTTIFKSVGLAMQDVIAAEMLLELHVINKENRKRVEK